MAGVAEEGKSGGKGDREVGAAWGAETGATGVAGLELWALWEGELHGVGPGCWRGIGADTRLLAPFPTPACTQRAHTGLSPASPPSSLPQCLGPSVCWAGPSAVKCLLTLLFHCSSPVKRFLPCVPTSTIHWPHYCGYHIAVIIINASLPC